MKNKEQTFTTLSWSFFLIAILMILFSLVAPIIFTEFYSKWNFTKTGQIGDTIGGIMNPFIAIGGVIATLLAFFMQIQANKIQRQQFIKSLDKSAIDEKIDCYYKLSLISLDLDNVIKDIKIRVKDIGTFINNINENPFKMSILHRAPLINYDRIVILDRLSTYKGFKMFLSDERWVILFNNLYFNLDYIPEAFKNVYEISKNHDADIFKQKTNIRDMLLNLEEDFDTYNKELELFERIAIKQYLNRYKNEISLSIQEKRESDLKIIMQTISSLLFECITHKKILFSIKKIILEFNHITQKNDHLIVEFTKFNNQMDIVNQSMIEIRDGIKVALNETSVNKIRAEYYINNRIDFLSEN